MEAENNNSSSADIRVPPFAPQFAPRNIEFNLLYHAVFPKFYKLVVLVFCEDSYRLMLTLVKCATVQVLSIFYVYQPVVSDFY